MKRIVSLLMAYVMLLSVVTPIFAESINSEGTAGFVDVSASEWYYSAVSECAARDVVHGVGNSKFAPQKELTFAELAMMVCNIFGVDTNTGASENWFGKAIDWSISNGYVDPEVNPSAVASREAAADFLYRVFAYCLPNYDPSAVLIADVDKISNRYLNAVKHMYADGIIIGTDSKGSFLPKKVFTRAEFCQVLTRVFPLKGAYDLSHMTYAQLALLAACGYGLTYKDLIGGDTWYQKAFNFCMENGLFPSGTNPLDFVDPAKALDILKDIASNANTDIILYDALDTYSEIVAAIYNDEKDRGDATPRPTSNPVAISRSDIYSIIDAAGNDKPYTPVPTNPAETNTPNSQAGDNNGNKDDSGTNNGGNNNGENSNGTPSSKDNNTGESIFTTDGGVSVTVRTTNKVEVPSFIDASIIYNGNPQKPTASNFSNLDTNKVTFAADEQTNAGNYTATFTLKDGLAWRDGTTAPKIITWRIDPVQVTKPAISANKLTIAYDGNNHSISENDFTSFNSNYYTITASSGLQKDVADDYTITISLASTNYVWSDNQTNTPYVITWGIQKSPAEYSCIPAAIDNIVYDGNSHVLNTAGTSNDGTIKYRMGDGGYNVSLPTAVDAGNYTIWCKIFGDKNHNDSQEFQINASIAQKTPTVTLSSLISNFTYDASSHSLLTSDVISDCGTVEYSINGETWNSSVPTAANADSYEVFYRVKGDRNIANIPATSIGTVTITPQPIAIPSVAAQLTYNSTVQTPSINNEPSETLATRSGDASGENAGTYTKTYTLVDSHNYQWDGVFDGNLEWVIKKAPSEITTAPSANTLTYDGTAQILSTTGSASGGTLQFSLDGDTWSEYVPRGTNAGGYFVYYKVIGDSNHEDTTAANISVSISKADPTLTTTPTAVARTYNSSQQAIVTAGEAVGGDVYYSTDNGNTWSQDIPQAMHAGSYTILYKIVGDDNHNNADPSPAIHAAIAKCDLTVTALNQTITYGDTLDTDPSMANISGLQGNDVVTSVSFSKDIENVGQGNITPSGITVARSGEDVSPDYNIITINGTIEITKASSTWVNEPAKIENLMYTSSNIELVTAGSANGGTVKYSLDNSTWGDNVPSAMIPNTYTVYYKVIGDSNHTDIEANSTSADIGKRPLTIAANQQTIIYGDPISTTTADVNVALQSNDTLESIVVETNNTEAGSGTISIRDAVIKQGGAVVTECYDITYATGALTIQKATPTITAPVAASPLVYTDGSPINLLSSVGSTTGGTLELKLNDGAYTPASSFSATGVNAGTYTIYYKVTGNNNYNSIDEASLTATISPKPIAKPTASGSYTYSGDEQALALSGYDAAVMVKSGTHSAINAGTGYEARVSLQNSNYKWSDNSVGDAVYSWSIAKRATTMSVSSTSITLDSSHTSINITITTDGDGIISASSSDTTVASVSVSGNTVTISSVGNKTGTANITISQDEGTNCLAASNQTVQSNARFTQTWAYYSYSTGYWEVYNTTNVSQDWNMNPRGDQVPGCSDWYWDSSHSSVRHVSQWKGTASYDGQGGWHQECHVDKVGYARYVNSPTKTYIGTVTAPPGTYPSNGLSGSYWYILQG